MTLRTPEFWLSSLDRERAESFRERVWNTPAKDTGPVTILWPDAIALASIVERHHRIEKRLADLEKAYSVASREGE